MPSAKLSHESEEPEEAAVVDDADSVEESAEVSDGAVTESSAAGLTKARQKAVAQNQRKKKPHANIKTSENPVWLVPTMLTLLIGGLVWIVVFYVTSGLLTFNLPIPHIGQWNLAIGFGMILGGGVLSTQYK
ncbi:uncharacterized protein UPF0233 [Rarobacter incanus]|uniref:Cell division protein CrgA n=1 Tax=Rarobacter incanus TaxID=153494 RepID=A0A542SPW9_9MICO|nr:uncharacterized protein UPF0233 [Rarobacter incanus]